MDEMNKIPEAENNEELIEQESPVSECEEVSEPVSESITEMPAPAPKPPAPKLPLIIGGAVAGVAAIAVSVALILGGGNGKHGV